MPDEEKKQLKFELMLIEVMIPNEFKIKKETTHFSIYIDPVFKTWDTLLVKLSDSSFTCPLFLILFPWKIFFFCV